MQVVFSMCDINVILQSKARVTSSWGKRAILATNDAIP